MSPALDLFGYSIVCLPFLLSLAWLITLIPACSLLPPCSHYLVGGVYVSLEILLRFHPLVTALNMTGEESSSSGHKIPKFEGKPDEDFIRWLGRLEIMLLSKGLWDEANLQVPHELVPNQEQQLKRYQAAQWIVNSLGSSPYDVVRAHIRDPFRILQALRDRYASRLPTSKVALLMELSTFKYRGQEMGSFCNDLEAMFNRLSYMGTEKDETERVTTLLAAFNDSKDWEAVITSIRNIDENQLTWSKVTSRLLEEYKMRSKRTKKDPIVSFVQANPPRRKNFRRNKNSAGNGNECFSCGQTGHWSNKCWKNKSRKAKAGRPFKKNGGRGFSNAIGSGNTRGNGDEEVVESFAALAMVDSKYPAALDTGCNEHMTPDGDGMVEMRDAAGSVGLGTFAKADVKGIGQYSLHFKYPGARLSLTLQQCQYVPTLRFTLISMSRCEDAGYGLTIRNGKRFLQLSDQVLVPLYRRNGLYWLTNPDEGYQAMASMIPVVEIPHHPAHGKTLYKHPEVTSSGPNRTESDDTSSRQNQGGKSTAKSKDMPTIKTIHRRLGHVKGHQLRRMVNQGRIAPRNVDKGRQFKCTACKLGKFCKRPFKHIFQRSSEPGELLHHDTITMPKKGRDGSKY